MQGTSCRACLADLVGWQQIWNLIIAPWPMGISYGIVGNRAGVHTAVIQDCQSLHTWEKPDSNSPSIRWRT